MLLSLLYIIVNIFISSVLFVGQNMQFEDVNLNATHWPPLEALHHLTRVNWLLHHMDVNNSGFNILVFYEEGKSFM